MIAVIGYCHDYISSSKEKAFYTNWKDERARYLSQEGNRSHEEATGYEANEAVRVQRLWLS